MSNKTHLTKDAAALALAATEIAGIEIAYGSLVRVGGAVSLLNSDAAEPIREEIRQLLKRKAELMKTILADAS